MPPGYFGVVTDSAAAGRIASYPELRPDRRTVRTAPERLAEVGDLFLGVLAETGSCPRSVEPFG